MATFRAAAQAALIVGVGILATSAQACDSNYPWLCKPVPSVEPSETTESTTNAKPLPISSRRRTATTKSAKQASERAARKADKRAAHKAAARRHVTRARQARAEPIAAAARAEEVDVAPVMMPRRRPAAAGPRAVDGGTESNSGFMAAWMERTGAPAQAERPVPAVTVATADAPVAPAVQVNPPAAPAAAPVRVASQNEVNELDLAAGEPSAAPSESSWLRSLFLAFGGLIAFGSALRLFL